MISSSSCSDPTLAARLLSVVVASLVPDGPIVIGMDDTIERRWGPKIAARGIYRDPVRSNQGHFVKASGLRWLSFLVLAPVPWANCIRALPVLTLLQDLDVRSTIMRVECRVLSQDFEPPGFSGNKVRWNVVQQGHVLGFSIRFRPSRGDEARPVSQAMGLSNTTTRTTVCPKHIALSLHGPGSRRHSHRDYWH
jgi:hypothetical protein